MNAVGMGYGNPTERDTGIAQALLAYASQGGVLLGAHRWAENPLTLTHVRWQGVNGELAEAFRPPERDYEIDATERNVWVEVAILSSPDGSGQLGQMAPWVPIQIDRAQAQALAQRVQQARASKQSTQMMAQVSQMGQMGQGSQGASLRPSSSPGYIPPHMATPMAPPAPSGSYQGQPSPYPYGLGAADLSQPLAPPQGAFPQYPQYSPYQQSPAQMTPDSPVASAPSFAPGNSALTPRTSTPSIVDALPSFGEANSANAMNGGTPWGGGWQRGSLESTAEVSVLVCIEIEMPVLIPGASSDYTRDFARDVATHFSRAARSLPQTRELRGWMRGGRIVLAARMGMAQGNRPPTRVEMEHAAMALSDALAQRTLPYTRLTFADPSEWAQGTPLPGVG